MISIVIPSWRRPHLLAGTLASLKTQRAADFEVIVVVDGPDEGARNLASSIECPFSIRWILQDRNVGPAASRNAGVRVARGDTLVFLDDDTIAGPDWLSAHAVHHLRKQDMVVVGRLRHTYTRPPHSPAEAYLRGFLDEEQRRLESSLEDMHSAAEVLWVGLNCSLPRHLFVQYRGMDERLRDVQEDAELASRLLAAGIRFVYEPHAEIEHCSTHDLVRQHVSRAKLFGASDVYRIRDKKELLAASPACAAFSTGSTASRFKHELGWTAPGVARTLATGCRWAGQATNMEFFFRQWRDLIFAAGYWQEVKAQGFSFPPKGCHP